MKRSETQVIGPALIAVIVAVAGVVAFQSNARAPGRIETPSVASTVPAPSGDVPFIGELTVTASRN